MPYAELLNKDDFAPLESLAADLLDEARELAMRKAVHAQGMSEDQLALEEEAQGLATAFQAVAQASPLIERALVVALAGAVGTILAQLVQTQHDEAWRTFFAQAKQSYQDVVAVSVPRGTA